MSDTIGVMGNDFQDYTFAAVVQTPINCHMHLGTTPSTIVPATGLGFMLVGELPLGTYQPARISSAQVSFQSGFPVGNWQVSPITFNLGSDCAGQVVRVWWIQVNSPDLTLRWLWGGNLNPFITVPPGGATIVIGPLDLPILNCATPPSPPLPGAVWFDPFIDVDGTVVPGHLPLIGTSYLPGMGTFSIADARLVRIGGTASDSVTFDPGVSDGTITFTPICASAGGVNFQRPAVMFRIQDPVNLWQCIWAPDVALAVIQRVLGNVTTTPIAFTVPVNNPSAAVIEIVLAGPSISLRVDDQAAGNVVDPTFQTDTMMGVLCQTIGSGSGASWRNLLVRH